MHGGMNSDHIDAETLERYALGHLAEAELGRVEEHLLLCQECRNWLIVAEKYVRTMREALRRPAE